MSGNVASVRDAQRHTRRLTRVALRPKVRPMRITDWVIDCDTHVTEPGDVWTQRVSAKWGDRVPHLVRDENGVDHWRFGKTERIVPVGHTAVAGWKDPFPAAPRNMDEVPAAAHDARARLDYLDSVGIWACAIYPNIGGFGNESFLGLEDHALMLDCVRAYNDWLIEWCSADARRFIPVMALPFWDVAAAADEVRRCAKLGHRGILFTGEPQAYKLPYLGDRHWDPLWNVAAETGLPVNLHLGSANFTEEFAMERIAAHGVGPTVVRSTTALFFKNAMQLTDLLMSGVLPRHPGVRFVSVESGMGWVPFMLESVDHVFGYSRVDAERPEYAEKPSSYFHRQVSVCAFFEEVAPQRLLDVVGADNVLFETDYPHPVCLYGNVREKIDAAYGALPHDVQRKVLWDNAAALYRVGAPDRPWQGVA